MVIEFENIVFSNVYRSLFSRPLNPIVSLDLVFWNNLTDYKLFGFDDVEWYIENIITDLITASVEHGLLTFYRETSGYLFELMQRTIVHNNTLQIGAQRDNEEPHICLGFQAVVLASGLSAAVAIFAVEVGWTLFRDKRAKRQCERGSKNPRLGN